MKLNIAVLDAATLGDDVDLGVLTDQGRHQLTVYPSTLPEQVAERTRGAHVAVVNKIKMNSATLGNEPDLKLICVAATGYDNIDLDYCRAHSIGVCNVVGYSSDSVALVTWSMVLSLVAHLGEYNDYVRRGEYTASGIANRLVPVYHELSSLTWGVVGMGGIGRRVAEAAGAMGARVIYNRRTPDGSPDFRTLDDLCREADIITIHTPLDDSTRGMISRERLALMKPTAILVNVARGAVTDEAAVAEAILSGRLGGFGCDVYSAEPFGEDHPFRAIADHPRVLLTPHMAWGAKEARERCLSDISKNITSYLEGGRRSRID